MKSILTIIMVIFMLPTLAMAGSIDFGASSVQTTQTETDYHLGFSYDKAGASLDMEYNYGQLDDYVITDNARLSLGYDAELSSKWGVWLDETVEYDTPAGIDIENFLGAGPKYTIYKTDEAKVSLSFGYLSHYQARIDGSKATLERWSWRFKAKKGTESAEIGLISMYQPAVQDSADYIFTNSAWYSMGVTDAIDLKLSVDSEQRQGVQSLAQMATIVYKFGE